MSNFLLGSLGHAAIGIVCALLAPCDGASSIASLPSGPSRGLAGVETKSLPQAPAKVIGDQLRLQAGDRIKVTVFGEEKLSGDYDIDPGGYVSLPLAGTIQAAGLTKMDLERDLAEKLRKSYLRNPKVTVDIATFRPFYVLGEVQKPGEYPFKSGLNVMSAIAVAGGATYRASNSKVYIQRSGDTALQEVPLEPSIQVRPGDLIRVPERYF